MKGFIQFVEPKHYSGSPNLELQVMAEEVYAVCKHLNITLEFVEPKRYSGLSGSIAGFLLMLLVWKFC